MPPPRKACSIRDSGYFSNLIRVYILKNECYNSDTLHHNYKQYSIDEKYLFKKVTKDSIITNNYKDTASKDREENSSDCKCGVVKLTEDKMNYLLL